MIRTKLTGSLLAGSATLASLAVLLPSAAIAQASPNASTAPELEEIVVTAQKRSERLQEVPIAITAVSGDSALRMGVTSSDSLSQISPGLDFNKQLQNAAPFIRGIGSNATNSDEASTAIYIDGVYQASPIGNVFDFNGIDRIEVLKGPQGTLFGRNANGGVIQIITKSPRQEFSARGEVGYGTFDTKLFNFYATGGLADNLAANIAVHISDQGQGWGKNLFNGRDAYFGHDYSVRSKILWNIGSDTSLLISAQYSDWRVVSGSGYSFPDGGFGTTARATPLFPTPYPGFYNVNHDTNAKATGEQFAGSVTLEHDFGWGQLKSITAYSDSKVPTVYDIDYGPNPGIRSFIGQRAESLSQEIQIASPEASAVKWIAGAFYLDLTQKFDPFRQSGTLLAAAGGFSSLRTEQKAVSYAAFAQTTLPLSANLNLTLGGRYTIDDHKFSAARATGLSPVFAPISIVDPSVRDKKFTYRAALDYEPVKDVLLYASVSRGFKSGLFIVTAPTLPRNRLAVKPETLDAYEVGFKSEILDNRLRLNGSAYYYDFRDIQLSAGFGTTGNILTNAPKATIKGFELEGQYALTNNVTMSAGVSHIDSKYGEFRNATCFLVPAPPATGLLQPSTGCDVTGNRTVRTPPWTLNASADFNIPLEAGKIFGNITYYYNDGYFWDAQNIIRQDDYSLVNATVGWASGDGFEIKVWAKNLGGSKYYSYQGALTLGFLSTPAPPRTYGVTASVDF